MKEPKSMSMLHAIRERHYKETCGLSKDERIRLIREEADKVAHKMKKAQSVLEVKEKGTRYGKPAKPKK